MLVILASRYDTAAVALARSWAEHDTAVLTCEDLSSPGWRYYLASPGRPAAIVAGRVVDVATIDAVLTRLPWVAQDELPHIVAEHRAYVAAEMSAFLLGWLSGLPCPVVNRPTTSCLMGPGWGARQWACAAAVAGLPVHSPVRSNAENVQGGAEHGARPLATVTVVGDRCIGDIDAALATQVIRLARAAGAELLTVRLSAPDAGASFISADLWLLVTPDVNEAVLEYLTHRKRC